MQLRKSVCRPARFDEDYDVQDTPRPSTKPAFSKMMEARIIPFNPDHPPAAFPSLPINGSVTLPVPGTCKEMPSWSTIRSTMTASIPSTRYAVEVVQHSNVSPTLEQMQMDVKSWPSLPISVQYHIYKRMSVLYRGQSVSDLLGLTDLQFNDLLMAVRIRDDMQFTEMQLWNQYAGMSAFGDGDMGAAGRTRVEDLGSEILSALSPSSTVHSFTHAQDALRFHGTGSVQSALCSSQLNASVRLPIDPQVLAQNLDHLALASSYELAYEAELNRAEQFLKTRNISTAVLGTWVPDAAPGEESECFTFLSEQVAARLGWLNIPPTTVEGKDFSCVPSWKRGWPPWQQRQPTDDTSPVVDCPYSSKVSSLCGSPSQSGRGKSSAPASLTRSPPHSLTIASTPKNKPLLPSPDFSQSNLPESVPNVSSIPQIPKNVSTQDEHQDSNGGTILAQPGRRETERLTLESDEVEYIDTVTHPISRSFAHLSFMTLKFHNIADFRKVVFTSIRPKVSELASLPTTGEVETPKTPGRQVLESSGGTFVSLKYTPTRSTDSTRKISGPAHDSSPAKITPSTPPPKEYPGDAGQVQGKGKGEGKRKISDIDDSPREISPPPRPTKLLKKYTFPRSFDISQLTTLLPMSPLVPISLSGARQTVESEAQTQPVSTEATTTLSCRSRPLPTAASAKTPSPPLDFAAELFTPLRRPTWSPIPENMDDAEMQASLARVAAPIRFNTMTGVVDTEESRSKSTNQNA
ncbi:hypothetical protein PV10_01683 [Exophiala mesophila]|uniref:Uncharacterized protein n=1 Tax=Exophiala mesophila TaxID=212818 RepID=A0A0D2AGG3_EXOME|nr:uncharacterized protein PV10_01683 [Exophiala mesophila]KIV97988.1 hypothetical protein PV10_01683 [Exophiala mesophila]